ncbi:MAG: NADH-quinone oxidoreductase subunit A [Candidatus Eisenbacteria bacterium]|uniref:NADH-quinone oxidoreductase subunit A n=1 Tax=Eiseniibacteriota bacterium TaxID=2212470 RepID=A0A948WB29_UNCEI|nr:NADH-quinone oxidoreductase subunit A [Candidatus Eisenbacteria bacterium]MBU1949250.1 NADH-quinone oxidoreductase subunit A [Candidatus Eisenbacteria bacterium]MBU2689588.1 NADH-quinone oxidoreductase subunit A [Candidatus Eisenbacteria bacterium]
MEFNFATALVFILLGLVFSGGVLFLSWLIRPSRPAQFKGIAYECGEQPVGSPWVKFNVRFYVVALIFVIFDVEVVLLYPWATAFKSLGLFAFVEMLVFLGLLFLGLAYVWKRGDLEWVKPDPAITGPGQRPSVPDAGAGEVTGL